MGNGSIIHQMLEMKKRPEPLLLTHDHRVHGSFLFIFACPEVPLSRILQVEVFEDVSKDLLEGGLLLFFLKILGLLDRLFTIPPSGFPTSAVVVPGAAESSRKSWKPFMIRPQPFRNE